MWHQAMNTIIIVKFGENPYHIVLILTGHFFLGIPGSLQWEILHQETDQQWQLMADLTVLWGSRPFQGKLASKVHLVGQIHLQGVENATNFATIQ